MCSIPNQEAIGAHMLSQQPNKLLRACRGPQKWHHNAAWPQVAWGARSPGYASETSKWDKAKWEMYWGSVIVKRLRTSGIKKSLKCAHHNH